MLVVLETSALLYRVSNIGVCVVISVRPSTHVKLPAAVFSDTVQLSSHMPVVLGNCRPARTDLAFLYSLQFCHVGKIKATSLLRLGGGKIELIIFVMICLLL